ncbi:MAG: insulinase family protein, partial [Planctomycetes bacterium]|nr:insulinase family protein [Planctomycetota bacterium]
MQVQARRPAPPAGVAALALFAFVAAARPAAAETQEKLLPNGLKIIVHEMHGAPLVTVMTLYRVGSVHEPAGRTGITHLCEHMLFKGSRRYPDGEVDRAVMRCGGYINGFTNTGQITFFQVVPRELLGEFLDRHADAMEQATFDPAEFKREMVVVRSELEGYENDPAYLLEAALFATAFQVHGLRWPIIGWRADVERTTAEDAREWYRAYFRPNNAVLIVTGDVDGPATLGEIERRFGGLARGRTPPEPSPEPPQQGERRVTLRLPASAPLLEIGYKNPPMGHADAFALEVLQFILGEGRGARLRRSLIDAGLAADAEANNYWDHCPTLFIVRATGLPGKDPAPIEAAIDADIARVQAEGVTAEEVAQAVRQTARRRAFALDSTEKTASSLGDFEGYSSYRYAFRLTEEVGKVTPERVQEVARKYLTKENRTVAWVLPTERPAGLDLRGAGAEIDRSPGAPGAANSPAGGAAATGTGVGGERPAEAPGQPEEFRLPNGLRVLVWANPAAPTMALRVRWPGGAAASGDHPGASAVALEMLHEGTLAHDRAAFRRELESRGLEIGTRLAVETAEL